MTWKRCCEIEAWHQGSVAHFRIMNRDSDGRWNGVHWNGQRAAIFALQETSETAAQRKLLASNQE
jgi:hypothetical protein